VPDISRLEQNFRQRWRDLNPSAIHEDSDYARYVSLARAIPLGHTEQTVTGTAAAISGLPADVKRMVLYSVTEDITYTDDGTDPGSAHGMIIPAEVHFVYDSDVDSNFKLWAPGSTVVRIAFYG
jgi:hypothetical protein